METCKAQRGSDYINTIHLSFRRRKTPLQVCFKDGKAFFMVDDAWHSSRGPLRMKKTPKQQLLVLQTEMSSPDKVNTQGELKEWKKSWLHTDRTVHPSVFCESSINRGGCWFQLSRWEAGTRAHAPTQTHTHIHRHTQSDSEALINLWEEPAAPRTVSFQLLRFICLLQFSCLQTCADTNSVF